MLWCYQQLHPSSILELSLHQMSHHGGMVVSAAHYGINTNIGTIKSYRANSHVRQFKTSNISETTSVSGSQ
jgi:hypothetical protein